jgi:hypothetical protein
LCPFYKPTFLSNGIIFKLLSCAREDICIVALLLGEPPPTSDGWPFCVVDDYVGALALYWPQRCRHKFWPNHVVDCPPETFPREPTVVWCADGSCPWYCSDERKPVHRQCLSLFALWTSVLMTSTTYRYGASNAVWDGTSVVRRKSSVVGQSTLFLRRSAIIIYASCTMTRRYSIPSIVFVPSFSDPIRRGLSCAAGSLWFTLPGTVFVAVEAANHTGRITGLNRIQLAAIVMRSPSCH